MNNNIKRSLLIIPIITGLASCSLIAGGKEDVRKPSEKVDVESFKEISVDFKHKWNKDKDYPYTGAAAIDIDQDGKSEIFVSGGDGQDDALFTYDDGKLKNIIKGTNLSSPETTYGASSVDLDNDGDTDLVIVRSDGVYAYLNTEGKFKAKKIAIDFAPDTIPLSAAVGDINKDGLIDLYISCFVSPAKFVASTFNNPQHSKPNVMLLNKGNLEFEDVTEKTNTQGSYNTFHSAFVDLNNDGNLDLVAAQNTGQIEIFKNSGDLNFEPVASHSGIGYWMGIATGDIDNDGDIDLFLSNVGNSIPTKFLRGDLKDDQQLEQDWILLRNNGDFKFTNATHDYQLDGYGFAWGAVFEDLNLDGNLDLLVSQNYIKWPKHKFFPLSGKSFLQLNENGKDGFYQVDKLGLKNANFGQSPVIADLNGDGKPDVFMANMSDEQLAFINRSDNNFVTLSLPDNAKYIGSIVTAKTEKGKIYTRQFVANTGLMSDSSNEIFFGLAKGDKVKELTISPLVGAKQIIDNPQMNQSIKLHVTRTE